jgi:hypothetical protein
MKRSVLLTLLTGYMILSPAANSQTASRPLPRTPTMPTRVAPPAQRFNLNGIWELSANGKTIKVQFEQHGDQFKSFYGVGNLGLADALLFEGRYAGGVIVGQRLTPTNARVPDTLTVDDPDHVRAGNGLMMIRISPAGADDAICDLLNSSHTQAGFAYDRALDAVHRNLPNSLNACWLQVSANQGHARAQAVTAMIFRDGEGVPKNPTLAFSWAQKSASQGDVAGEVTLADMYSKGIGTAPNPQLAKQWRDKANIQLAQQRPGPAPPSLPQADTPNQLTPAEVIGLLVVGSMLMGDGGSPQPSDPYREDNEANQRKMQQEIEDEQRFRHACDQAGGNVSSGVFGSPICQ